MNHEWSVAEDLLLSEFFAAFTGKENRIYPLLNVEYHFFRRRMTNIDTTTPIATTTTTTIITIGATTAA